jgi:hypothetical protein
MSFEDWPDKDSWKLGLHNVLAFGKHKGKTVEYVLNNDPNYILCVKEKNIHKLKPEVNQLLKETR